MRTWSEWVQVGFVVGALVIGLFGCTAMRTTEAQHRATCEASGGHWKQVWEWPYGVCE